MKLLTFEQQEQKRRLRNQEILTRMQQGESLNCFDSYTSWFPPRPIVKKDRTGMNKLYGRRSFLKVYKENQSNLLFLRG
jgi:hypothetical protein